MPSTGLRVVIEHLGLALINQSNHTQAFLDNNNSIDSSYTTNTPIFPSFSTTKFSTTTTAANTTTSPAPSEEDDPTSWIYIFLGVLCWVAIFVGCGFAWTQLCKAFYFSSGTCSSCARGCRRNPGINWLVETKFFRFYFGKDCCCCKEDDEDEDDESISTETANSSGQANRRHGISNQSAASGRDSVPSTGMSAPPPPYEVAIFMRRPGENSENVEMDTVTLGRSSQNDAGTSEPVTNLEGI